VQFLSSSVIPFATRKIVVTWCTLGGYESIDFQRREISDQKKNIGMNAMKFLLLLLRVPVVFLPKIQ
jgi:hypothetical protein